MNTWKKLFTLVVLSASFSQQMVFAQQDQYREPIRNPEHMGTYRRVPGGGWERFQSGGSPSWRPATSEETQKLDTMQRRQPNQPRFNQSNRGSNEEIDQEFAWQNK